MFDPRPAAAPTHQDEDQDDNTLTLLMRDGLDQPIHGLSMTLTLPTGENIEASTAELGNLSLFLPKGQTGEVKVAVKDIEGKTQPVCIVDLAKCKEVVIIRSPKVEVTLPLRPHQQTPPTKPRPQSQPSKPSTDVKAPAASPSTPWWVSNGAWTSAWSWLSEHLGGGATPKADTQSAAAHRGLSQAGQPLTVVAGPEGPNPDNLRLGRNNVYRTAILGAAKRLGLIPQALCALIDCEAGKVTEHIPKIGPDGKQLQNKKGKLLTQSIHELWNANAGNAQSGAAGLTQFLGSTWLSHVLRPGFYIHTQSVANGWVRQDADVKGKTHWVFVLADGKTTTNPYVKRSSDDNVKKCLAMRMDPTWSINAAADYGNANLKLLAASGLKLSVLNDMDKAKVMYLMHHEGEGCGPLFIRNKLSERKDGVGGIARLKQVFALQLGPKGLSESVKRISNADDDVGVAYRWWIAAYINRNFSQSARYFFYKPLDATKLTDILTAIGGVGVQIVD
jgi:hypothetical protein